MNFGYLRRLDAQDEYSFAVMRSHAAEALTRYPLQEMYAVLFLPVNSLVVRIVLDLIENEADKVVGDCEEELSFF